MDSRQSRANKAKGRTAENAVCDYLNDNGYATERRRTEGVNDRGDVTGLFKVVIEVKNTKQITLASFIDEAKREAANDGPDAVGVAWIKKRGTTNPADWYVAMDGATFLKFLDSHLKGNSNDED